MRDLTQESRRNERLRGQARLNPWNDVWEFESVGDALLLSAELLQETADQQRIMRVEEALLQADVWKSRTDSLPHAIESTAAFAQIILRDVQGTVSSSELRLAYASTILRTINGLADVLQQQRVHAASVSVLCQQLGIPSWLVGIRHESTHNQLPSLAVLRLSSKSLLHYFRQVYWDPLARAKLDHLNDANALLHAYHKAALQLIVAKEEQTDNEHLFNEQSIEQEKSNETQVRTTEISFQSKLGTSFNSFAVLQSSSKKTKEKRKKPKQKSASTKKQKKQEAIKIVHVSSEKTACPSCGQAFVKANVPLDILRYALLSYLIWKGPEHDEISLGGVLFAETPEQGMDSFDLLKQRYEPLIQAACRAWPGFLTTLLVHVVDALLSMEAIERENSDDEICRKLSFLEQWVRCLLSKAFLAQTFPNLASELKIYKLTDIIGWKSLLSLQLPLNSLCDRCEDEGSSNPSSSSKVIARLFEDMLGSNRVKHFGATLIDDSQTMIEVVQDNASPLKEEKSTSTNTLLLEEREVVQDNTSSQKEEKPTSTNTLSLEEMELLLGDKDDNLQTQHQAETSLDSAMAVESKLESLVNTAGGQLPEKADQRVLRKSWVRCTHWDACAIGSLPGYPQ